MKSIAPLLILLVGAYHTVTAQTYSPIQTSQPMLDPGSAFVALSGYHGALQVNAMAESSIPGVPSNVNYYELAVDGYLENLKAGVGAKISHLGFAYPSWDTRNISLRAAPKFKLSQGTLLTGFGFEFFQTRHDWHSLFRNSSMDPAIQAHAPGSEDPYLETRNGYATIGSFGYHNGRWLGVYQFRFSSQQGLLQSVPASQEFYHSVMVNYSYSLTERATITPGINYLRFSNTNILRLSLNGYYRGFFVGGSYNPRNLISGQIGYKVKQTVLISYTYVRVSTLGGMHPIFSHSIGIRTTLGAKKAKDVLIQNLWIL